MTWAWLDEVLPDAVVVMDERHAITVFSPAAERLWGYQAHEVLGRPLSLLLPERFRQEHGEHARLYAAAGEPARRMDRRGGVVARRRDGVEIPCEVSIAKRGAPGSSEFVAIVRDLSDQQRMQRAALEAERGLAQSEATLRALFAGSREAMVLLDEAARVRAFNEAAAVLAGQGGQRLEPGNRLEAFGGAHLGDLLCRAFAGEYAQAEAQLTSSPPRWLELSASPVRLPGGTLAGLIIIGRDVTERRHTEEQLRHAQKMDTVGQLAGGIAHDFNNLLTVIIGGAGSLRDDLAPASPLLVAVEDIEEASRRAAALTRQLLSFARLQPWAPRVIEVGAVVTAVERMLRRVIGSHVALRVDAEPGCYVRIDPTQLEQVLMNLAVNARDAMPAGGTVTITVTRSGPSPFTPSGVEGRPSARASTSLGVNGAGANQREALEGTPEVCLQVADTGPGIDPAIRERLFELFFTTKAPGRGTGLGLATCYGIVRQAHGRIELTSAPGEGACFTLHFPLAEAPEDAPRGPAASPAPGGRELVLVAEDEPRVRGVVMRALEGAGYRVLATGSGVEALEALGEEGRDVSLIITDVVMPRMGGPGVAAAVRDRLPPLPVLLISGYPDSARLELVEDRVELLLKPFTAQDLLTRVRRLLDAQPKRREG